MKKYKENESQRDEYYAQTKKDRLAGSKVRGTTSVIGGAGSESSAAPSDMFAGEDLAIARKRERATATAQNTIIS